MHRRSVHNTLCPATVRLCCGGPDADPAVGASVELGEVTCREGAPTDTVTVLPWSSPQLAEERAYGWSVEMPGSRLTSRASSGTQVNWNGTAMRWARSRRSAATSVHNSCSPFSVAA